MAELRVERKRPSVWRWVVLLLIVALLVWAVVELMGGAERPAVEEVPDPVASALAEGASRAL